MPEHFLRLKNVGDAMHLRTTIIDRIPDTAASQPISALMERKLHTLQADVTIAPLTAPPRLWQPE